MNDKDKNSEIIKSVLIAIAAVAAAIMLFKKLADWLKNLDDDSFKWSENFGGYHHHPQPTHYQDTHAKVTEPVKLVEAQTKVKVTKPQKTAKSKSTPKISINKTTVAGLNSRQSRIYQIIKANKQIPMQAVADRIGSVSTRTLRRDMNRLEQMGLISRQGRTKDSVYSLS